MIDFFIRRHRAVFAALAAAVAFLVFSGALGPVPAAVCERIDVPTLIAGGKSVPARLWCVSPHLSARKLDDAAPGISAAACISANLCIVASDDTRFVQAVRLDVARQMIVPLRFVYLADTPVTGSGNDRKEPAFAIEAAAASGERVLLAGSHGATVGGAAVAQRQSLFEVVLDETRLAQWPAQRSPDSDVRTRSDAVTALEPEDSKDGLVRQMLDALEPAQDGTLKSSWARCLQDNGFSIEGLALAQSRLLIGLRGPLVDGMAPILAADRDAFLAGRIERPEIHVLPFDGLSGVRALQPMAEGILVLTGRSQHEPVQEGPCAEVAQTALTQPALYYWGGPDNPHILREVARFSEKRHQPEAMILLGEDAAAREIELLMFFGDQRDGAPVSYRIPFAR